MRRLIACGLLLFMLLPALAIASGFSGGGSGGSGTPGGNPGDFQVNSGGALGGITISGDCTVNTGTGAITCTKTNTVAFGPLATASMPGSGTELFYRSSGTALGAVSGSSWDGSLLSLTGANFRVTQTGPNGVIQTTLGDTLTDIALLLNKTTTDTTLIAPNITFAYQGTKKWALALSVENEIFAIYNWLTARDIFTINRFGQTMICDGTCTHTTDQGVRLSVSADGLSAAAKFLGDVQLVSGQLYMVTDPLIIQSRLSLSAVMPTDGTRNFLTLTGTLPASPSAAVLGLYAAITSAGSAAQAQIGSQFQLLAGYTGSSATYAGVFDTNTAGTGNTLFSFLGNYAVSGNARGTTTGLNAGVQAVASGGNVSIGTVAFSVTAKNSATNIGVAGFGLNTGSTPIQIGGYFGLQAATPTFASAALMADNGATTSDIFVARDNGTAVFTIADGGTITGTGVLQAGGYKSSDGSAGVTGATCTAWKNGLCTTL